MICAAPSTSLTADVADYPTGLTGTLDVRISNTNETHVVPRITSGIVGGTDPGPPDEFVAR